MTPAIHSGSSFTSAMVGNIIDPVSVILRLVVSTVVASDDSRGGYRDEGQWVLEAAYRNQLVGRLVAVGRVFGAHLSDRCIAAIVHILSELVLSSSKFLNQVRGARMDWLEGIDGRWLVS